MKKLLLLFVFSTVILFTYAQKNEATIYLKDGTILTGLSSTIGHFDSRVRFKATKKSKRKIIKKTLIDSIRIKEKKYLFPTIQ